MNFKDQGYVFDNDLKALMEFAAAVLAVSAAAAAALVGVVVVVEEEDGEGLPRDTIDRIGGKELSESKPYSLGSLE